MWPYGALIPDRAVRSYMAAILARLTQPDRKKAAIIFEDMATAHLARGAVHEASKLAKSGLGVLGKPNSPSGCQGMRPSPKRYANTRDCQRCEPT